MSAIKAMAFRSEDAWLRWLKEQRKKQVSRPLPASSAKGNRV